jgi:outer membrane lipoprotein-sorting protein
MIVAAGVGMGVAVAPAALDCRGAGAVDGGRAVAGAADDREVTLEYVESKIESAYEGLAGLSMSFEQINSWSDMPEAGEASKGVLWAAGGGRLRMQYSEPPGHLLVSDGARVWVYVPENKQAVVDSVGSGERTAMAEMIMDFLSAGRVSLAGREEVRGRRCYVLEVNEVSDPPGLKSVKMWVDPKTWLARKLKLEDVNGNVTSFTFWDTKRLKKVDAKLFTFTAPPGVEIVRSPVGSEGPR